MANIHPATPAAPRRTASIIPFPLERRAKRSPVAPLSNSEWTDAFLAGIDLAMSMQRAVRNGQLGGTAR